MKNSLTTLAAAAALALALPVQAASIIGFANTGTTTVGNNAVLTLTLDVSEDVALIAMTFNLDWPVAGLALDLGESTALNQSWAAFALNFDPNPDFTVIEFLPPGHFGVSTFFASLPLTAGTHTVGISFVGLAAGDHTVSYDLSLGDLDGGDHQIVGSADITVTAVPEASPSVMLAAGLAVLGLLARRRRV